MVHAGLAGTTPRMQGSTVSVLARLIYEFNDEIPSEMMNKIMTAVCKLLEERNREVVKAVVGFCKVVCIRVDENVLVNFLPSMVKGLCRWSDEGRNLFRQKIRSTFEALANRFGADTLTHLMPPKHQKLADHIRKETAKKAREKAERWGEMKKESQASIDIRDVVGDTKMDRSTAMLRSKQEDRDVEEVLFDVEDNEDVYEEPRRRSGRKGGSAAASEMTIVDPDIDFLAPGVAKRIVRGNAQGLREAMMSDEKNNKEDEEDEDERDQDFAVGKDGKLIIKKLRRERKEIEMKGTGGGNKSDKGKKSKKKRNRQQFQPRSDTRNIHTGKKFKSRKGAGGDVTRKGSAVEPYAYVPLNPAHLNKRKVVRAKRAFESVVTIGKRKGGKGRKGGRR